MPTSKKAAITIPKYSGANDNVPFDKWLRLFEVKTAAAAWTERDKLCHFSDYLEGEAFRWYLTEVFDTGTAWEDIVACMTQRFASAIADPFRQFIHCRLKSGQSLKEHYDEKMCLGCLADLKDSHLIAGLIDGLPDEMEMALAGLTPSSPAAWLSPAICTDLSRTAFHQVDTHRSMHRAEISISVRLIPRHEPPCPKAGIAPWLACHDRCTGTMNAHDAQAFPPSLPTREMRTQSYVNSL